MRPLLRLSFRSNFSLQANKKAPDFATTYNNTEQKISVHFTSLEVLLHQEALLHVMAFAQKLAPPPAPAAAPVEPSKPSEVPTSKALPAAEEKTPVTKTGMSIWLL